jgi:hypothetical protein
MTSRDALFAAWATAFVSVGVGGPARADTANECISAAEQSQPLRREGKLRAARERLLACSRPECPSVVRADCTRWLGDLDSLMPTVVVHAVDSAGADVAGVRVSIDGTTVPATGEGREFEIDPGAHVLRFEHDGSGPVEQQIVVREAERHRILSVSFVPVSAAAKPAQPKEAETAAAHGPSLVVPIALVVAGGAGLAVASYFWLAGLGEHSRMASSCAPTHTCPDSEIDAARGKLLAGDVVGGGAIVAAAVGVGLLVFGHGSAREAPAVALQPLRGGALAGVEGRF